MQIRRVRSTGRGGKAKGRGSKCFHILLIFDSQTTIKTQCRKRMKRNLICLQDKLKTQNNTKQIGIAQVNINPQS